MTVAKRYLFSRAGLVLAALMMLYGSVSGTALGATTTTAYTYDELGRLKSAAVVGQAQIDYSYDAAGNRTQRVVTTGANQPPVVVGDSITTTMNTPLTFYPLANDNDPNGDTLTISNKTNGSHGSVTINSGTSLTFTPTTSYVGPDSFTYTVSDGHSGTTTGTVSVNVVLGNRNPTAVNDSRHILGFHTFGVPYRPGGSVDVLANDSDLDGDPLTITGVSNGSLGTVTTDGMSTSYVYNTTVTGSLMTTDTFTYTISDGHGGTAIGTVTVNIDVETYE